MTVITLSPCHTHTMTTKPLSQMLIIRGMENPVSHSQSPNVANMILAITSEVTSLCLPLVGEASMSAKALTDGVNRSLSHNITNTRRELSEIVSMTKKIVQAFAVLDEYRVNPGDRPAKQILARYIDSLEDETVERLMKEIKEHEQKSVPMSKEDYVRFIRKFYDEDLFQKDHQIQSIIAAMNKLDRQYDIVFCLYARLYRIINKIRGDQALTGSIPTTVKLHVNLDEPKEFIPETEGTPTPRRIYPITLEAVKQMESKGIMLYPAYESQRKTDCRSKVLQAIKRLHDIPPKLEKLHARDNAVILGFLRDPSFYGKLTNTNEAATTFETILKLVPSLIICAKAVAEAFGKDGVSVELCGQANRLFDFSMRVFVDRASFDEIEYDRNHQLMSMYQKVLKTKDLVDGRKKTPKGSFDEKLINYIKGIRTLTSRTQESYQYLPIDWLVEYTKPHSVTLEKKQRELNSLRAKRIIMLNEVEKFQFAYKAVRNQIQATKDSKDAGTNNTIGRFRGLILTTPDFDIDLVMEDSLDKDFWVPTRKLTDMAPELDAPDSEQYDYGTNSYKGKYGDLFKDVPETSTVGKAKYKARRRTEAEEDEAGSENSSSNAEVPPDTVISITVKVVRGVEKVDSIEMEINTHATLHDVAQNILSREEFAKLKPSDLLTTLTVYKYNTSSTFDMDRADIHLYDTQVLDTRVLLVFEK